MEKLKKILMELKEGDKIAIIERTSKYNTSRNIKKRIIGYFIKDYGLFFQIYDKNHIRKSINKNDVLQIKKGDDENV